MYIYIIIFIGTVETGYKFLITSVKMPIFYGGKAGEGGVYCPV